MTPTPWISLVACVALMTSCYQRVDLLELASPAPARDLATGDVAAPDAADMPDIIAEAPDGGEDLADLPPVEAPAAPTLSAGFRHSCAIVAGDLWCWGDNSRGQLGDGTTVSSNSPKRIGDPGGWTSVVAGRNTSCGLRSGELWCWGENDRGIIANQSASDITAPTRVTFQASVLSVDLGEDHGCALVSPGQLWCWGYNFEQQLGIGRTGPVNDERSPLHRVETPRRIDLSNAWRHVTVGGGHSCGIRGTTMLCWGRNSQRQLGLGADAPNQIGRPAEVAALPEGQQGRVVTAGEFHTCTSTASRLWCWGQNLQSQIMFPAMMDFFADPISPFDMRRPGVAIDSGPFNTCLVDDAGELWCQGSNYAGKLAREPVGPELGTDHVLGPQRIPGGPWREVVIGWFHLCATRTDDTVWCWGENAQGQLGVGEDISLATMPRQLTFGP